MFLYCPSWTFSDSMISTINRAQTCTMSTLLCSTLSIADGVFYIPWYYMIFLSFFRNAIISSSLFPPLNPFYHSFLPPFHSQFPFPSPLPKIKSQIPVWKVHTRIFSNCVLLPISVCEINLAGCNQYLNVKTGISCIERQFLFYGNKYRRALFSV